MEGELPPSRYASHLPVGGRLKLVHLWVGASSLASHVAPYEIEIYRLSNYSRDVCNMAIVLRNVTPNTCLPLSREGDHEVVEGEYRNKLNCVGTGVLDCPPQHKSYFLLKRGTPSVSLTRAHSRRIVVSGTKQSFFPTLLALAPSLRKNITP